MVDPDGGVYFDEPAKDGIRWAIQIIEGIEEKEAGIRRESRKRCLDEIEALAKREDIEAGVGADVESVYLIALQREANRRAKV
jgi:hypothetical protein